MNSTSRLSSLQVYLNFAYITAFLYGRDQPLSGRGYRGRAPSMPGRKAVLVYVYAGAAAGVIRVLPDLPQCLNFARARRYDNATHVVGGWLAWLYNIGRTTLTRLETGPVGTGARLYVESFDGHGATRALNPEVYVI